jgi:O-methyltransferase domain/Dimerisation domain
MNQQRHHCLSKEAIMDDASTRVIDLIFGRWRSQILYTGVKWGVFDALASGPKSAIRVASELGVDAGMLYRLMRALGSLELLKEDNNQTFSLTPMGELLRRDHSHTLRGMTLWEEGPLTYSAWKHLPDLIKEGKQEGFVREFGRPLFEYLSQNPSHGEVFNEAMSSYSSSQTTWALEALEGYNFSGVSHLCDVGGGHGQMLCSFLAKHRHLKGTVLELSSVIENTDLLWADKMGVGDRCTYVAGDMFTEVPPADAYMMKMILHDWNDEECMQILSNIYRAAPQNGRVFVIEHVIPDPDIPHFSKLFDIHMLVMLTGRERTTAEYAGLLERAGWQYLQTWYPASRMMGVVEGVKA